MLSFACGTRDKLNPRPSPGDPLCRHFVQPVLRACAAARLARVLLGGVGLIVFVEALPLAQMETGDAFASPVFVVVTLDQ